MGEQVITIVGLGLIGGSLSLRLRSMGIASRIIGVEANEQHAARARDLTLADELCDLDEAIDASDVVFLAIPVDAILQVLPRVLDRIDRQIVVDMGSTKLQIEQSVAGHSKRDRYVSTHPMWGTEYSGPDAAVEGAFADKAVVICNASQSSGDALDWVREMYLRIGMHVMYMDADAHDVHTAYISHISHITSFALANTVLEKEREEDAIFELASAGFASTVRLAKSNPAMWAPIFMQNRDNVLDVLNEHITQLRKFKACLEKENYEYLIELMNNANKIRKIIR